MRIALAFLFAMTSVAAAEGLPPEAFSADVVFLGEVHDNPAHHVAQADAVAALSPAALVFEMLNFDQAHSVTPLNRVDEYRLENAIGWEASGWPDFSMYYPIFQAAPDARVYGAALARTQARQVMSDGIVTVFGVEAEKFGLTRDLPADQQAAREAMQFAAHCDALPLSMVGGMVAIQRVRDARLAQEALKALADTGGLVVVITGNGHARRDWGAPATLSVAAPEVAVFAVGQGEDGTAPQGTFDTVLDAPAPARPDPCDAFR